ncbi:hypothetical protein KFL_009410010, partial [Klebsormidium nitens]
ASLSRRGDIPRQGRAESQLKPWYAIVRDFLQEGKPVANMNRGEKHLPQRRESRSPAADATRQGRRERNRDARRGERDHRRERSRSCDWEARPEYASPERERSLRDEPDRERRQREKERARPQKRRSLSREKSERREERGRNVHTEKEQGGHRERRRGDDKGVSKGGEKRRGDAKVEERGQGDPISPLVEFDREEQASEGRGARSKLSPGFLRKDGGETLQETAGRSVGRSSDKPERRKSGTTGERSSDRAGGRRQEGGGEKDIRSERNVERGKGRSSDMSERQKSVTTSERGSDRAGGRGQESRGKERESERGGVKEGRSQDSGRADRPRWTVALEENAHEGLRKLPEVKREEKRTGEVSCRDCELGDDRRGRSGRSPIWAEEQLPASSEALEREARFKEKRRKDAAYAASRLKLSIVADLWMREEEDGILEGPPGRRGDSKSAGEPHTPSRASGGAQAGGPHVDFVREAFGGAAMEPLRVREDSPASVEAVDSGSPWKSRSRPKVLAPKSSGMVTKGNERRPGESPGIATKGGERRPSDGGSSVVEDGKRTASAFGFGQQEGGSARQIGCAEKPGAAAAGVEKANGKTIGSRIAAGEVATRGPSRGGAGPAGKEEALNGANGMQDLDRMAAQGVARGDGERVDFGRSLGVSAGAVKRMEKAAGVQSPAASVQRLAMSGGTGVVELLLGPSQSEEDFHTVFEEASGPQISTALTALQIYSESESESGDEEADRPLFQRMGSEAAAACQGAGGTLQSDGGGSLLSEIGAENLVSPPPAAIWAAAAGGAVEEGVEQVAEVRAEPGSAGDQEEPLGDQGPPASSNSQPNVPGLATKGSPEPRMPPLEDPNTPSPVFAPTDTRLFPQADNPVSSVTPAASSDKTPGAVDTGVLMSASAPQGPEGTGIETDDITGVANEGPGGDSAEGRHAVGLGALGAAATAPPAGGLSVPPPEVLAESSSGPAEEPGARKMTSAGDPSFEDGVAVEEELPVWQGQRSGGEQPSEGEQPSAPIERPTALDDEPADSGAVPGERTPEEGSCPVSVTNPAAVEEQSTAALVQLGQEPSIGQCERGGVQRRDALTAEEEREELPDARQKGPPEAPAQGAPEVVAAGLADGAPEALAGTPKQNLVPLLVARLLPSPTELLSESLGPVGGNLTAQERRGLDLTALLKKGWETDRCPAHPKLVAARIFCVDCSGAEGQGMPCCAACSKGDHRGHLVFDIKYKDREWLLVMDNRRNLNVSDLPCKVVGSATGVRIWPRESARPSSAALTCKACGGFLSARSEEQLVFCSLQCKMATNPKALLTTSAADCHLPQAEQTQSSTPAEEEATESRTAAGRNGAGHIVADGGVDAAELADALNIADDVSERVASEAPARAADTRTDKGASAARSLSPSDADWLDTVLEKGWEKPCREHAGGKRLFCIDCAHKPGYERPVCAQCVKKEHEGHRVVNLSPGHWSADYWLLMDGVHDLDVSNVARRKTNNAAENSSGAVIWPRESEPKNQTCFKCKGCRRLAMARGCVQKKEPEFCSVLCKVRAVPNMIRKTSVDDCRPQQTGIKQPTAPLKRKVLSAAAGRPDPPTAVRGRAGHVLAGTPAPAAALPPCADDKTGTTGESRTTGLNGEFGRLSARADSEGAVGALVKESADAPGEGIADGVEETADGAAVERTAIATAAETDGTPCTNASAEGAVSAAVPAPRERYWGPAWLEAVLEKGWEEPCDKHPQPKRFFCVDCAGLRGCERPVSAGCFDKKHKEHNTIELRIRDGVWRLVDTGLGEMEVSDLPRRKLPEGPYGVPIWAVQSSKRTTSVVLCQGCFGPASFRNDPARTFCSLECKARTDPKSVRPTSTDPSPGPPAESEAPTELPMEVAGEIEGLRAVGFKSINALDLRGEEADGLTGRTWRKASLATDGARTVAEQGVDCSGGEQLEAAALLEDPPTADRGDEPRTGDVILAQETTAVAAEKQTTGGHAERRETENGDGDMETPEGLAEAAPRGTAERPMKAAVDSSAAAREGGGGAAEETVALLATAGDAPGQSAGSASGAEENDGLATREAVPPGSLGVSGAGLSNAAVTTVPHPPLEGTEKLPASTGAPGEAMAMSDWPVEGTADGGEEAARSEVGEKVVDGVGEGLGPVPAAGGGTGSGGAEGTLAEGGSDAAVQNVDDAPFTVEDATETVLTASEERGRILEGGEGQVYKSEKSADGLEERADGVAGGMARAPGEGAAEVTAADAGASAEKVAEGDPSADAAATEIPAAGPRRHWGPDWLETVFEKGWAKPCSTHKYGKLVFCLDCAGTTQQTRPTCAGCLRGDHQGHELVEMRVQDQVWMLVDGTHDLDVSRIYAKKGSGWSGMPIWPRHFQTRQTGNLCLCYGCGVQWPFRGGEVPAFCSVLCKARTNPHSVSTYEYRAQQIEATDRRVAAGRIAACAPLGISDPLVDLDTGPEETGAQRAKARKPATEDAELSPGRSGVEEPGTERPGVEEPGTARCAEGASHKGPLSRDRDGKKREEGIDDGARAKGVESAATSEGRVDAAAAKRALVGFRVGRELPRGTIVLITVGPKRMKNVPGFHKKQGVVIEAQADGTHKVFRGKAVCKWNRSFQRSELQVMGIPKGHHLRAKDFEKGSWDGKMTAEEITNGAGLLDADGRSFYKLRKTLVSAGEKEKAGVEGSDASRWGDDISEGGVVLGKRRQSGSAGESHDDEGGRKMSLKKVMEASDASKKKPRGGAANSAQEAALKKPAPKASERRVSRELLCIVGDVDLVAREERRATRARAKDPQPAVGTGRRGTGGKRKLDRAVEAPKEKKARSAGDNEGDEQAKGGAETPNRESGALKLFTGGMTELAALLANLGNEGIGLGLDAHAVLAGAADVVSASAAADVSGSAALAQTVAPPAEAASQGGAEPGTTVVDLDQDEPSSEDATPKKRQRRSAPAAYPLLSDGVQLLDRSSKRAAATKACQKIKQNLIRERIPITDDGEQVPQEKAEPVPQAAAKALAVPNRETEPHGLKAPRPPTAPPAGLCWLGSGRVAPTGGSLPGQMQAPASAHPATSSIGHWAPFKLGDPVADQFASQILATSFRASRNASRDPSDRLIIFRTETSLVVGGRVTAAGAILLDQWGLQLHRMGFPGVVVDRSAKTVVSLLPVPVPFPGAPIASVFSPAVQKGATAELQARGSAAPATEVPPLIPSRQTSDQEPVLGPGAMRNGAPSVPTSVAQPVTAQPPPPERIPTPSPRAGSIPPEEGVGPKGKRQSAATVACLALGTPREWKRQRRAEEECSPAAEGSEVRSEDLSEAAELERHEAEGTGGPVPSDPVLVSPPPADSTELPDSKESQLGMGPLGIEAVPIPLEEPHVRPKRNARVETSKLAAPPAAARYAVIRTRPAKGGPFATEKIIAAPDAGVHESLGEKQSGPPAQEQTRQGEVGDPPETGPPTMPVTKRKGRPPKKKLDEAVAAPAADVTGGADVSKGHSSGADVGKGAATPAAHTPQKKRSQGGKRPQEKAAGAAGAAAADVGVTHADVSMTEAAAVAAPLVVPKAAKGGKGRGLQQQQAGRSMSAVAGGAAHNAIVPRGAVSAVGEGGAASNGAANGKKLVVAGGRRVVNLPAFLLDSSDEESDDEEEEEEDHGPPEELMAMCKLFDEVRTDYKKVREAIFYLHYLKGVTMTKDLLASSQVDVRVRALMAHAHAGVRNQAQKLGQQWEPLRRA